jgi:hypothetical protein
VGATGDAAVANHFYFVADSVRDLGELVKRAPREATSARSRLCLSDASLPSYCATVKRLLACDALRHEIDLIAAKRADQR